MNLKVVTWNVNSVLARLERVKAFIDRQTPDILLLQELKCVTEAFPTPVFESLGYHCLVSGQKAYNGVALLSKIPFKNQRLYLDPQDPQARFVSAEVAGITLVGVYVPNGQDLDSEKFPYKLQWYAQLQRFIEEQSIHKPLLLAGDFNVAPEDKDVYDPQKRKGKILFSDPEKKALESLVSVGLLDCFRTLNPEPGHYSWWDYRALSFQKNLGMRIDFIFITPPLKNHLKHCTMDRNERKGEKPSDHIPVIAEFDWNHGE